MSKLIDLGGFLVVNMAELRSMVVKSSLRATLPYGRYVCENGREVLFNRSYAPLWEKSPDAVVSAANRKEWIEFIRQDWFYDDLSAPYDMDLPAARRDASLRKCLKILSLWGIDGMDPSAYWNLPVQGTKDIPPEFVIHTMPEKRTKDRVQT